MASRPKRIAFVTVSRCRRKRRCLDTKRRHVAAPFGAGAPFRSVHLAAYKSASLPYACPAMYGTPPWFVLTASTRLDTSRAAILEAEALAPEMNQPGSFFFCQMRLRFGKTLSAFRVTSEIVVHLECDCRCDFGAHKSLSSAMRLLKVSIDCEYLEHSIHYHNKL